MTIVNVYIDERITHPVPSKLDAVLELLAELKGLLVTNQQKLDGIATAIDAATVGIKADIDALKAAVSTGQTLDFSALDAKVAALAALDAENPPVS